MSDSPATMHPDDSVACSVCSAMVIFHARPDATDYDQSCIAFLKGQLDTLLGLVREMAPRMKHYAQCNINPNLETAPDCECGLIKWRGRARAVLESEAVPQPKAQSS